MGLIVQPQDRCLYRDFFFSNMVTEIVGLFMTDDLGLEQNMGK